MLRVRIGPCIANEGSTHVARTKIRSIALPQKLLRRTAVEFGILYKYTTMFPRETYVAHPHLATIRLFPLPCPVTVQPRRNTRRKITQSVGKTTKNRDVNISECVLLLLAGSHSSKKAGMSSSSLNTTHTHTHTHKHYLSLSLSLSHLLTLSHTRDECTPLTHY